MSYGAMAGESSGMGSALINGGFSLINGKLNYDRNIELAQMSYNRNKDLQKREFQYGQMAQYNAARNNALGMRAAGLNPQAMGGSEFAPANGASASVGTPTNTPVPITFSELAQAKLATAEARKADAEAANIETDVERKGSEDATQDLQIRNFLSEAINSEDYTQESKEFFQSLLDNESSYDAGTAKAIRDSVELRKVSRHEIVDKLQTELDKQTKELEKANQVPAYLAAIPVQQWSKTNYEILNLYVNTALLASETSLNSVKARELESQISLNLAELNKIYHGDFASMWQNGDYSAFFTSLLSGAAQTAIGVGTDLLLFKGAGTAAKTLGAAGSAGETLVYPLLEPVKASASKKSAVKKSAPKKSSKPRINKRKTKAAYGQMSFIDDLQ